MILLIKQDRPANQNHNSFYFILDEQWFKLTAHDMKAALVSDVLENHRSQTTPETPMSNFISPSPSASVRSPSIGSLLHKDIKNRASAYSILRDEGLFDKFQKDLFITAKSHDVSEILDPIFTPGPSQEENELFEEKNLHVQSL